MRQGEMSLSDHLIADLDRNRPRGPPATTPSAGRSCGWRAEAAERTLTERPKAPVHVNHSGRRLKVEVTREEFEEATAALLERTRMTTEIVVRQAGLTWADIDRVLLVGGSTRMPMVGAHAGGADRQGAGPLGLARRGGRPRGGPVRRPAGARRRRRRAPPQFTVTNVNSHSLGILGSDPQTGRKFNKMLIPKNSPLPQHGRPRSSRRTSRTSGAWSSRCWRARATGRRRARQVGVVHDPRPAARPARRLAGAGQLHLRGQRPAARRGPG